MKTVALVAGLSLAALSICDLYLLHRVETLERDLREVVGMISTISNTDESLAHSIQSLSDGMGSLTNIAETHTRVIESMLKR